METGDIIYSLSPTNKILDWEFLMVNPRNKRFFIFTNCESGNIAQVHWKTLEYGTDTDNFFSRTKKELLERYEKHTNEVKEELKPSDNE
jgi:hypothetical protein